MGYEHVVPQLQPVVDDVAWTLPKSWRRLKTESKVADLTSMPNRSFGVTVLLPGGDSFRVEMSAGEPLLVACFGEVDLVSMAHLEAALAAAVARKPTSLMIDISNTTFVSVQGFSAIAQCRQQVARLTVQCRGGLAQRVFQSLGYPEITCVSVGQPRGGFTADDQTQPAVDPTEAGATERRAS